MYRIGIKAFLLLVVTIGGVYSSLYSCTDFQLKAKDNAIINARTMEFALLLNSEVRIHPRKESRMSKDPFGGAGITWESKYGVIGANVLGLDVIIDGFNEKGLSFGALWFPGAKYQEISKEEASHALAIENVGLWMLGNFATVKEVKEALKTVKIWGRAIPGLIGELPLHLAVHDANGHSLVVEFIEGKTFVYDNPGGVLTNYPGFDWHRINLQNYVNLTAIDKGTINYHGTILGPTGHGSGLLGIPGDWTPPSRFVRISIFKQFATRPENGMDAINLAEHLLNSVDIPKGDIRSKAGSTEGDYTQWSVIKDLTNQVFYFRTYQSLGLQAIDLKKVNLGENGIPLAISMDIGKSIVDVTDELHEVMPTVSKAQKKEAKSEKYYLRNE